MNRKKTISISSKPHLTQEGAGTAGSASVSRGPATTRDAVMPSAKSQTTAEPAYGILAKSVYGVVYSLTFGAVLSSLFLSKIVPGSGVIRRAMHDGSDSAQQVFHDFETKAESGSAAEATVAA